MMTHEEIENDINFKNIRKEQDSYFLKHGVYLQKLPKIINGYSLWIDIYDGPGGQGYTIGASDRNYYKVWNFGPEIERDLDWST